MPTANLFFQQTPFIRVLPALMAGILLQFYLPHSVTASIVVFFVSMNWLILARFKSLSKQFRTRWVNGAALLMMSTALGSGITWLHQLPNRSNWIGHLPNQPAMIACTLLEAPIEKTKLFKAEAMVTAAYDKRHWKKVNGRVMVYFSKNIKKPMPINHSTILTNAPLLPIINDHNPGTFQYSEYLAQKGIYHQIMIKEETNLFHYPTQTKTTNILPAMQQYVLQTLRKYIPDKKQSSVAEALVIGYKEDLDKDLLKAYSNTGVIHVIAISGLHLGMLYGLLTFFFKPFKRNRLLKSLGMVMVLLVLWGFTCLAGAGPSVSRAAIMFSFIAIGDLFKQKTNGFHGLTTAAFFLLIWNPFYLWDIGFQLSFTAVAGIFLFKRPIELLWYTPQPILRQVWQMCAITLSAQLLTLPLILYHFHQFPNLFLVANVVIVPISGCILYACLFLMCVAPVQILAFIAGKCLSGMLWCMNTMIETAGKWSFAVTDNLRFNLFQSVAMYVAMACCGYWLAYNNRKALLAGITCIAGITTEGCLSSLKNKRQQGIIVYAIPKRTAIDIIAGNTFQFIGEKDSIVLSRYLQPARSLFRLQKEQASTHPPCCFSAGDLTIGYLDHANLSPPVKKPLTLDVLVIGNNPKLSLRALSATIDCRQYVFDASNPLWKIRQWKKEAESLHLRHHSVPEEGAFVMVR